MIRIYCIDSHIILIIYNRIRQNESIRYKLHEYYIATFYKQSFASFLHIYAQLKALLQQNNPKTITPQNLKLLINTASKVVSINPILSLQCYQLINLVFTTNMKSILHLLTPSKQFFMINYNIASLYIQLGCMDFAEDKIIELMKLLNFQFIDDNNNNKLVKDSLYNIKIMGQIGQLYLLAIKIYIQLMIAIDDQQYIEQLLIKLYQVTQRKQLPQQQLNVQNWSKQQLLVQITLQLLRMKISNKSKQDIGNNQESLPKVQQQNSHLKQILQYQITLQQLSIVFYKLYPSLSIMLSNHDNGNHQKQQQLQQQQQHKQQQITTITDISILFQMANLYTLQLPLPNNNNNNYLQYYKQSLIIYQYLSSKISILYQHSYTYLRLLNKQSDILIQFHNYKEALILLIKAEQLIKQLDHSNINVNKGINKNNNENKSVKYQGSIIYASVCYKLAQCYECQENRDLNKAMEYLKKSEVIYKKILVNNNNKNKNKFGSKCLKLKQIQNKKVKLQYKLKWSQSQS